MAHGQGNAVLVIDDDEINLSVARLILEKTLKCRVLTADNAVDGLKIMKSQPVCVVLLDIEMPEMNGFETLAEIRSNKRIQNIPVIMLTSVADRETLAWVMQQGVEGYIKKPFLPEKLTEKVAKFLRLGERALTVLVVDDDDIVRATIGNWITDSLPYHVIKAKSGAAALEQMKNHTVQIVLLDAGMPGMDGFQLLGIMDMSEKLRAARVILMLENEDDLALVGEETSELLAGKLGKPLEKSALLDLLVEVARSCHMASDSVKYHRMNGNGNVGSSGINVCI